MSRVERNPSPHRTSPGIRRLIESQVERYRAEWLRGQIPQLADYLDGVTDDVREQLLPALLEVELAFRHDGDGSTAGWQSIARQHPQFATEIRRALDRKLDSGPPPMSAPAESKQPADRAEATVVHTPTGGVSSGLHIRCPHCSNPVELVAETPFEDITCASCGSRFNLVDRDEATSIATPLETLGRFELISRLGLGGFGAVWKARDTELDRIVAVKVPRKGHLSSSEAEQFFREARSAAQLRHPNIVTVHEVGREKDTIFIVSDFIRGVTLANWLTGQSPSSRDVAEICQPVAAALHHAHEAGVIHRDLKPSNIMIDEDGRPHLTDFGLAKREVGEITMTVDGQVLGTPAYMSPEQAGGKGHWTDRRTDIYSLGVIVFRMLTGELPFRGNSQMQVHQRLCEDAPDPRSLNRHIPKDMATICLKCLERDPTKRYKTAQAVADELRRFRQGSPIEARPITRSARVMRWARRKPSVAATVVLMTVLAIAGPAAALVISRQNRSLESAVDAKDNLIVTLNEEQRKSNADISQMRAELELLSGQVNPWEIWPPEPTARPRERALRQWFQQQYPQLLARVSAPDTGTAERTYGRLALAIIADQLGEESLAREQYFAAAKALEENSALLPDRVLAELALADCWTQLARLHAGQQRDEAERFVNRASAVYQRLETNGQAHSAHVHFGQLESQLHSAVLASVPASSKWEQVQRASAALESDWPTDPIDVYQLATYLANRPPWLLLNRQPQGD